MAYKTYKVRDMISHRTYGVRRDQIRQMEAPLDFDGKEKWFVKEAGCEITLNHPVKNVGNRHRQSSRIRICAKTLKQMGLWSNNPLTTNHKRWWNNILRRGGPFVVKNVSNVQTLADLVR